MLGHFQHILINCINQAKTDETPTLGELTCQSLTHKDGTDELIRETPIQCLPQALFNMRIRTVPKKRKEETPASCEVLETPSAIYVNTQVQTAPLERQVTLHSRHAPGVDGR